MSGVRIEQAQSKMYLNKTLKKTVVFWHSVKLK